jgi:glycogen debranching enzyme
VALHLPDEADAWARRARDLQARFERCFWAESLSLYALALDGRKRPCLVRASNAGQCLFTEIVSPERARRVVAALMDRAFFSGWGIRTLAESETRYNPMSYHNGSIWPHDNALIAYGMSRYGFTQEAQRILDGLFDASYHFDLHRMPELYCGFHRRADQGPTLYPVACSPQSWAAASVFLLLQACLGLSVEAARDGSRAHLTFRHPRLPPSLQHVGIRNLRVGEASIDLDITRYPRDVSVDIVRRDGPLEVVTIK